LISLTSSKTNFYYLPRINTQRKLTFDVIEIYQIPRDCQVKYLEQPGGPKRVEQRQDHQANIVHHNKVHPKIRLFYKILRDKGQRKPTSQHENNDCCSEYPFFQPLIMEKIFIEDVPLPINDQKDQNLAQKWLDHQTLI
jgi:hypothetical protein